MNINSWIPKEAWGMTGMTLARSPILSNGAWIFTPSNIKKMLLTKSKTNPSLIFYTSLTPSNRVGLKQGKGDVVPFLLQLHNCYSVIIHTDKHIPAAQCSALESTSLGRCREQLQLRPTWARATASPPLHPCHQAGRGNVRGQRLFEMVAASPEQWDEGFCSPK